MANQVPDANALAQQLASSAGGMGSMMPSVSFSEDEIEKNGKSFAEQTAHFTGLASSTTSVRSFGFPGAGVAGKPFEQPYATWVDQQVEAYEKGKAALESWSKALRQSSANYRTANANSTLNDGLNGDGGGLNGLNVGDLGPGGNLPKLPGFDMPGGPGPTGPGVTNADFPTSDLTNPDLTHISDPNLSSPEGPDTTFPTSEIPDPNLPSSNLPNTSLPDTPDFQQNQKVPDINAALNGPQFADQKLPDLGNLPDKTDLANFNPNSLQNQLPNANLSPDLNAPATKLGPTAGGGGAGTSVGTGGVASALPASLRTTPASGGSGMPMSPFMPMGGGMHGGDREREKEQSTLLAEDEAVWGGEDDVAPRVIGQEEI